MKRLILIISVVFLVFFTYSQDYLDPLVNQTLEKFGLSLDDHRGLVLYYDNADACTEQAENKKEAIEKFFLQSPKKDITYIYVKNQDTKELSGVMLDMKAIIQLYIDTTLQH